MKFVALVSGGKDSCFNILHCIKNGHELIALANLYPPESHGSDELDSFMYQTVGYHAVELYGEALDIPLYREPIVGKSIAQGLDYLPTANDESEDLYLLLSNVKKAHPDVEAVSVGAILSTYQRTRVENVCLRLGLISLSFLWQRSQAELLDEIIDSGLDARIIKTAGIGLNKSHLGKGLGEMRSELIKLNKIYGLHLCGEGGEYETLVFDAPIFKKRLVIKESKVIDHSNDDVSYLSIRVGLEKKDEGDVNIEKEVIIPPLLDETFQEIYDELNEIKSEMNIKNDLSETKSTESRPQSPELSETVLKSNDMIAVGNLMAKSDSLESEVNGVFQKLDKILEKEGFSLDNITFISLLVQDMNDFQIINKLYSTFFTKPNPPARFCIQASIPLQHKVQLSAIAIKGNKNGLHVQGQSYWAPANIGPYSQAISINGLTYLAGQIGLIPSRMQLHGDSLVQLTLSLQNIVRVLECTFSEPAYCVAFVSTKVGDSKGAFNLLSKAWGDYIDSLNSSSLSQPGLLAVGVPDLPRSASYEWTCLGIERNYYIQYINYNDQEDNEDESFIWPPKFSETNLFNITQFGHKTAITIGSDNIDQISNLINSSTYGSIISATIYTIYTNDNSTSPPFPAEVIPSDWIQYRGKSFPLAACLLFSL